MLAVDKNSIRYLASSFSYESILEQIPSFICVQDMHSKVLYSNNHTAGLFGYPNASSLQGVGPYDMRCPAVESAPDFIKQDQYVRSKQVTLTILDIHRYVNDQEKILLTKKAPYYDNGVLAGCICQCDEIYSTSFTRVAAMLMQSDKMFYPKNKNVDRAYVVGTLLDETTLSKQEMNCLFYLIRGLSMKDIALRVGLSWRTVESYLNNIKYKWDCANKKEVIAYAISHGLLNYIPPDVLSANTSFILHEGCESRESIN